MCLSGWDGIIFNHSWLRHSWLKIIPSRPLRQIRDTTRQGNPYHHSCYARNVPFPNGLLLEQQGWKFVSSKYKWLENAHQARFGSNWLLCNGKNQLKKKKSPKKIFFWKFFGPPGIVWNFNPGWSRDHAGLYGFSILGGQKIFKKNFFRQFFFSNF